MNWHSDDRQHWEEKFVSTFVLKPRRRRYRSLLGDREQRHKILDRLNHGQDIDFSRATGLRGEQASANGLNAILRSEGCVEPCWLMSDDPDLDCRSCSVLKGVELAMSADWGTVLICPPRPVVIYRPEASEASLYLLR